MPTIYKRVDDLVRELATTRGHIGQEIISVDGNTGSGKTTLAKRLAQGLCCKHIKLDDFLERNGRPYLEQLRLDDLRLRLEEALTAELLVVLDGVLMDCVLERLDAVAVKRVYVKAVFSGRWLDENELCDSTHDSDDPIRQPGARIPVPPLIEDIIRYHHERRPDKTADYVYERTVKTTRGE